MRKKNNQIVAREKRMCILCDETYDTGNLLMSTKLRHKIKYLDHRTTYTTDELEGTLPEEAIVGHGLCDTCKKDYSGLSLDQYDHACCVAIDPDRSVVKEGRTVNPSDQVWRTGEVVFIRRSVWDDLFNAEFPSEGLCFMEPEVIEWLSKIEGVEVINND